MFFRFLGPCTLPHNLLLRLDPTRPDQTRTMKPSQETSKGKNLSGIGVKFKVYSTNSASFCLQINVTIMCRNDELSWLFTKRFRAFLSDLQKIAKCCSKFLLFPFSKLSFIW